MYRERRPSPEGGAPFIKEGYELMGRLSMFLEGFRKGTQVLLYSKNGKLIFKGVKEDIPYRFNDQVNILLGSVYVDGEAISITVNYDDEN